MSQPIDDHEPPALRIEVERTGGVAGMRRAWRVEPPVPESGAWLDLVDRCPWRSDARAASEAPGADRFHWTIVVVQPGARRTAEFAGELPDPWRGLVDAVRRGRPAEPGAPMP